MNPGYPGTFDPQFATKSRMVSVEVGYPTLLRKNTAGDTNKNPPYSASKRCVLLVRSIRCLI